MTVVIVEKMLFILELSRKMIAKHQFHFCDLREYSIGVSAFASLNFSYNVTNLN